MHKAVRSIVSVVARRLRSRAAVELENLALRHQLHVLRRRRPGRPRLFTIDRLLWIWLYRIWPRCLDAMVLVKPATVVQWHREGFRLFWRWRSRSGRPSADRKIRALIRQMSRANPLWGAPRIHGELLKLGLEISQAMVAKYMVRRRGTPSPTWRSFLSNQAQRIAAIDMLVVASVSFQLFYVLIILGHDRRKIIRAAVTEHPTAAWLTPGNRSVSIGDRSALSAPRPRLVVRFGVLQPGQGNGHHPSRHGTAITLAEPLRRAGHRLASPRVSGSPCDFQRAPSTPHLAFICRITTIDRAPLFRSTRTAPTHAPSCRAGSERWSKSHNSAACIIATNASPPDSQPLVANGLMRAGPARVIS